MLQWCFVLSIVMAVLGILFWIIPTPSMHVTFKEQPARFVYRNIAMALCAWYDIAVSLALVIFELDSTAAEEDNEGSLYTIAVSVSAFLVALTIAASLAFQCSQTCFRLCCCCCSSGSACDCSPECCAESVASRLPCSDLTAESLQKKMLSAVCSVAVTGYLAPFLSRYSPLTSGTLYLVIVGVALITVIILGQIFAHVMLFIQFALVTSGTVFFSIGYAARGSWTNEETTFYAAALVSVICMTTLNVLYNALLGNRDLCTKPPGAKKKEHVPLSQKEDENDGEKSATDPTYLPPTALRSSRD
jgi:hypothetical protein